MANLYIKRFGTNEVVRTIPLQSTDVRYVERVMLGALRNMGDDFYIDDAECGTEAPQDKKEGR